MLKVYFYEKLVFNYEKEAKMIARGRTSVLGNLNKKKTANPIWLAVFGVIYRYSDYHIVRF